MKDVENFSAIQTTFQSIYERKLWCGSVSDDFWSGRGSHEAQYVEPFLDAVRIFASGLKEKCNAVDLGCGDFNIGCKLRGLFHQYVACDVVPELIERNKEVFAGCNVDFRCLEMTSDALPSGDVVFIRHVLQHLSNERIARLLPKLSAYKFLVLTEGLPKGQFVANLDMRSGAGIRIPLNSGVVLTDPPFNLAIKSSRLLCDVPHGVDAVIRTTAYELS